MSGRIEFWGEVHTWGTDQALEWFPDADSLSRVPR